MDFGWKSTRWWNPISSRVLSCSMETTNSLPRDRAVLVTVSTESEGFAEPNAIYLYKCHFAHPGWHEVAVSPAHGSEVTPIPLVCKAQLCPSPSLPPNLFPKKIEEEEEIVVFLFFSYIKFKKSYCIKENSETMLHKSKKLT